MFLQVASLHLFFAPQAPTLISPLPFNVYHVLQEPPATNKVRTHALIVPQASTPRSLAVWTVWNVPLALIPPLPTPVPAFHALPVLFNLKPVKQNVHFALQAPPSHPLVKLVVSPVNQVSTRQTMAL
jgi:hypothetical protein